MDKVTSHAWQIVRYAPSMAADWHRLLEAAANATFIFERDYMDYHADRFADHSLVALRDGRPLAILPANITDDGVLHSHQGLTYGGWIVPRRHFDGGDMLDIFGATADFCRAAGIVELDYKPLPWIYAPQPAQDDIYALARHGAVMTQCNLSCTVTLAHNPGFNTLQRRHLRKALALGVTLDVTDDVAAFWDMLTACLAERHSSAPVHTLSEIGRLRSLFPSNIRFFTASLEGTPHAGVCIYDTGTVAHCQYIATTPEGRRLNLLTPLISWLMTSIFPSHRYFDFGTSNEDGGRYLNRGLLRQKSSLGGSGVAYTRWSVKFR